MGLLPRLKARLGALFAPAEDPRQALPSVHERQMALLQRLQAAVVEVALARQRLAGHIAGLRAGLPPLEEQARHALQAGREDLARLLLQRRHAAALELERLEAQEAELAQDEQRLTLAERGLAARLEAFRLRREVLSARHTAAETQVRLTEALAGAADELADLDGALERTEAHTERLRARVSILDELDQAGLLADSTPSADPLERELSRLDLNRAVDDELAALKRELGQNE